MATSRNRRKRNRGQRDSEDDSVTASKTASPSVQWEWETDMGAWQSYSYDMATKLTDGFLNRASHIDLVIAAGRKVRVEFAKMCQINMTTGWQRNVRCIPLDPTYQYSQFWQWQDFDSKSWVLFDSALGRFLEAAMVLKASPVEVAIETNTFEVDVPGMTLRPGDGKGRTQSVRRLAPDDLPKWEWENEHGNWVSYADQIMFLFESAKDSGDSTCTFKHNGNSYKVYFDRMEQKNERTRVTRKVRRTSPRTPSNVVLERSDNVVSSQPSTSQASSSQPSTSQASSSQPSTSQASSSQPSTSQASSSQPSTSQATSSDTNSLAKKTSKEQSLAAPVDVNCIEKLGKAHVYLENGEFWDAMLNQTNLKNNNNKFYIIQLLEDDAGKDYSVWMRWGRVGLRGQSKLEKCGPDLWKAKQLFEKKFADKTKNNWAERKDFVKFDGKYDLLAMDYTSEVEKEEHVELEETDSGQANPPTSKLPVSLQELIQLICDIKTMEETVIEMKYDTQKAPLGKLTKDQIKGGYVALKKIEGFILKGDFGDQLVRACDEFYTRIPHCFGLKRPPILRTMQDVRHKVDLLQALGDIEIAIKMLFKKGDTHLHPIDRHYQDLNCMLEPLNPSDDNFKMVQNYLQHTHGKTHSGYTLKVVNIFQICREGEEEKFMDIGNRMLLWHGSRLSNWVGILSQGLRIAPPEAPVTGYMFGKGVYFADMCSKSANYCWASKSKNDGLLLLCDVALGTTNDLLAANNQAHKLPSGTRSTKGLGRTQPDPKQNIVMDGCTVPLGTPVETAVSNPHGYTLQYNEYIVYNTNQVKMKYLVQVKFNFK